MTDILERIDAASNGLGIPWLRVLLQDARTEIASLRDSDGSRDGRDPQGLDGEAATARAEGIAESDPS